jgi:glucose-1-phosphate cytidylyltransferase
MEVVPAIILCGGQGTRLRSETECRPKAMVEVGGQPILWHILQHYRYHGLNQFIVACGYKGEQIREHFVGEPGVSIADTGLGSMTGERVQKAAKYITGDTFAVTYGDGVSDVNLADVLAFHQQHGKLATVTAVRPRCRYGKLSIDPDGTVNRIEEKPIEPYWINCGYLFFELAALEYFDSGPMETGALTNLAAIGQLAAYKHDGFFVGMDTAQEVAMLNDLWNNGKPPWRVW